MWTLLYGGRVLGEMAVHYVNVYILQLGAKLGIHTYLQDKCTWFCIDIKLKPGFVRLDYFASPHHGY